MTVYEWIFYGICRLFMSNDDYVRRFHGVDYKSDRPSKYKYDTTPHNKWGSGS